MLPIPGGHTLLSSQYSARHWSPGFQACSTLWLFSGPRGPWPLPCPDLFLDPGLFGAFFLESCCSLLGGNDEFAGLIGPVLLCSISPFWKVEGSPVMIRQSRGNPASWDVPEPPPLELKFGGPPSLCRSKWFEFGRSLFPILLLLLCSSILSWRLLFPLPSSSSPAELVSLVVGGVSFTPLLLDTPAMFPPPSPFLYRCWWWDPLNSICWSSLERV